MRRARVYNQEQEVGSGFKHGFNPRLFIRPVIAELNAYVPGEQPQGEGLIKLNTNENPYPPSPAVLAAVRAAVNERLRLYPNPTAAPLRAKLAQLHQCSPENIIVGNGSDELLALAVRAFVEPQSSLFSPAQLRRAKVQYFVPSYSLYPVLGAMNDARLNAVPLLPDFGLPSVADLERGRQWDFHAALTFVTTPNAPTGRGFPTADLDQICQAQQGVVVLDEAYVDFARENALALALKHAHVLVMRTFSKAYSLCFQRVGYAFGHPELVGALHKIRDSYNVNGLGQVAAVATLDDLPYYQANFARVVATRERLAGELGVMGFEVAPSQSNFLFARPPGASAETWLGRLRDNNVLVRWFGAPETENYLRISIGSDTEANALLDAVKAIVAGDA